MRKVMVRALPVVGALAGAMVLLRGCTLGLPLVTLGKAPGCTDSLVNIGATVHPLGLSGTVSVTVSYDRTNANGSVIAGRHTSVTKTIPLTAGGPPVTVSECAAAL